MTNSNHFFFLDLKEWNDSRIFKNFLDVALSPDTKKLYEDLLKKFLERTKQEILQNNKFIDDDFLVSLMLWKSRGPLFHDKTIDKAVVHNLLDQLIERNQIKTSSIWNICFYLHINVRIFILFYFILFINFFQKVLCKLFC